MQRTSNILKPKQMRSGMALIMAIALLVVLAGIMATMLNTASQANKRTEHLFFKEQAQLLAKSATEFALLAISGHDRQNNTDCIQTTTSQYPPGALVSYYTINTNIRYLGLIGAGGTCLTNRYGPAAIATTESEGTVLIDVYVTSNNANLDINETISYHRRTLQKP